MAHVSMYSYRIVSLLGLMIFLGDCLILVLLRILGNILNYQLVSLDFLFNWFGGITSTFTALIYIAFIPAVLFSFFLLIANIVLFIKEGHSLHNMLGM